MKIILDTNFLMVPVQFRVDVFEKLKNHELFTLDLCINELKRLAKGKGKDNIAAKTTLELIKKKKVKIIKAKSKTRTDAAIIEIVKRHDYIVATNDKELIKTLKKYKIKIIRLKQRKYLIKE